MVNSRQKVFGKDKEFNSFMIAFTLKEIFYFSTIQLLKKHVGHGDGIRVFIQCANDCLSLDIDFIDTLWFESWMNPKDLMHLMMGWL